MLTRNKVALAALMLAFTLTPASAAKKPQKNGKASTSSSKKKTVAKKAAVWDCSFEASLDETSGASLNKTNSWIEFRLSGSPTEKVADKEYCERKGK